MCFYEKQTPLQYLHVILFDFFVLFFFFFFNGYTSVDQFLLKDCNKSTYFTGLPLKGTERWQGPRTKWGENEQERNVNMSIYGRAERDR